MSARFDKATADEQLTIAAGNVELFGDLVLPEAATGLVVFVHGSGSSRFSSRNLHVADVLSRAGLGTLLMDLLTPEEEVEDERTSRLRFNIPMLADRVGETVRWLSADPRLANLKFGCFGASTGAAAALIAAARHPDLVYAVVSRGGRPDLAAGDLSAVKAPTLLIVGGADSTVLEMNTSAFQQLRCAKRLEVVPGATHLFEEPGALDSVALLAQEWFTTHLSGARRSTGEYGSRRRRSTSRRFDMTLPYRNRREAGVILAGLVRGLPPLDSVVLGLPRGGVPVAFEVARALDAPLDVFVVRKLGVPGHEELAMGAIASGGTRVLNDDVVDSLRISPEAIDAAVRRETIELRRREVLYRDGRPPVDVRGKRAILVDDGLATGATMRAAVAALRALGPAEIVVAVPVAAVESCDDFRRDGETCICAETPEPFYGVGLWYRDFEPTSDEEVRALVSLTPEEAHP